MTEISLLIPVLLPFIAGLIVLALIKYSSTVTSTVAFLATLANLIVVFLLFKSQETVLLSLPWAAFGVNFSLKFYTFSAFITLSLAVITFLIALYSAVFLREKRYSNFFWAYYLINLSFANGAVLADNLLVLLFFWEGLLLSLFGLIYLGGKENSSKTAIKTFIIVGVTDLCMMFGIATVFYLTKTLTIAEIRLPVEGIAAVAFILLVIGALSKAGSMPFHSWIPDAATDAPLPFMAIIPGAMEKLIGIYFLTRISFEMFDLKHGSCMSMTLMSIGAITIVFAVGMALIQKDYKRLLSFHAISQVGYMVLGVGTALPIGFIGALFHMINNALYKSCLFLTAGAVEMQTGTTDLRKLGGLRKRMPITFACFAIAAASISGVPPFNGFFSKELLYDAAIESGMIFYVAAALGSFLTAASFLKLGHAAFFGQDGEAVHRDVKESPVAMLLPMVILAVVCIVFGVYNTYPIDPLLVPILGQTGTEGAHHFSGWPANTTIVIITLLVLGAAILNHLYGVKKTGRGVGAVDHIHHAPVLHNIYDSAEKRAFDPYEIAIKIVQPFYKGLSFIDRSIDFFYNKVTTFTAYTLGGTVSILRSGVLSTYILWSLVGGVVVIIYVLSLN